MDFQPVGDPRASLMVGNWLLVNTHLAGSRQQVQLDVGVRKAVVVHRLEPLEVKREELIADPPPKASLNRPAHVLLYLVSSGVSFPS